MVSRHRLFKHRRQAAVRQVQFETLESRHLLTGSMMPSGIDSLTIDPEAYDQQHVLVRFVDPLAENSTTASIDTSQIIPGSQSVPLLDSLPSLQRVSLPAGVDVEQALARFRATRCIVRRTKLPTSVVTHSK